MRKSVNDRPILRLSSNCCYDMLTTTTYVYTAGGEKYPARITIQHAGGEKMVVHTGDAAVALWKWLCLASVEDVLVTQEKTP